MSTAILDTAHPVQWMIARDWGLQIMGFFFALLPATTRVFSLLYSFFIHFHLLWHRWRTTIFFLMFRFFWWQSFGCYLSLLHVLPTQLNQIHFVVLLFIYTQHVENSRRMQASHVNTALCTFAVTLSWSTVKCMQTKRAKYLICTTFWWYFTKASHSVLYTLLGSINYSPIE